MWRKAGVSAGLICALCTSCAVAGPQPTGIGGRVVAGPTCPVERNPPLPQCSPRPLAVRVRISRVGKRHLVKVVRSAADGHFKVFLPAGTYSVRGLEVGQSPLPRPPSPFRVHVRSGRLTHVTITYDTGIR
jgi:hypothetical protein